MGHTGIRRIAAQLLCAALCCVLLLAAVPAASAEPPLELASEAAILMDADTGQILYAKNIHRRMYPASITKIMTGMLALRELDPGIPLVVSRAAYDSVPRTSSHIGLKPGEVLSFEQTMYALSMESANDAANVLAEAISGNQEKFAEHMTAEAKRLGAAGTHFANANGLPDEMHYTTAYDMALIAQEALQVPDFTKYFGAVTYEYSATNLHPKPQTFTSHNQIISGPYTCDGVLMSKTGFTSVALGTLVTAVKQKGATLIAVVLKSARTEDKYEDTRLLLDYGFSRYKRVALSGEQLAEWMPLEGYYPLADQEIIYELPADADLSEINFMITAGAEEMAAGEETAVVSAMAVVRGLELPTVTLNVTRQKPEALRLAEVAHHLAELTQLTESKEKINILPWLVLVLALVPTLAVAGLLLLYRIPHTQRTDDLFDRMEDKTEAICERIHAGEDKLRNRAQDWKYPRTKEKGAPDETVSSRSEEETPWEEP